MKTVKIRYLDDAIRVLNKIDHELDESLQVIKQQQKLLASVFVRSKEIRATLVFNVSPTDPAEQRKQLRRLKTKLDPSLTKVHVPDLKKLQSQYSLAEDLYSKLRTIESVETQLTLAFPNRRGDEYEATMAQIQKMKTKIETQLRLCFTFLSDVAQKHVPQSFTEYVEKIAELVNEYVIFKECKSFMYVSVTPEGDIAFTNYLMLLDVANDEGEITPQLYVSIQWVLAKDPYITVDLNHEYEVPNQLLGSGEMVGDVGEATKAISDMLELENFSSALGVVPLALQLKVDPTTINPQLFSYRDFISKIGVSERALTFRLRKEAASNETVTEIAAQLYKELKALLKSKSVRLTMKTEKVKGSYDLTFNIIKIAEGGEFNTYDFEFLRDRFGLNNVQLRKISNIVNQGSA